MQFAKDSLPDEEALLDKLKHVWYLSKEYESSAPLIGILTTDNRKIWANNRKKLLTSEFKYVLFDWKESKRVHDETLKFKFQMKKLRSELLFTGSGCYNGVVIDLDTLPFLNQIKMY